MKRILSILLCIICLISMISGCGSGKGKFKVEYDENMEEFNVLELPCTVKLDGKYGYLGEEHTDKSITIDEVKFYQRKKGEYYSIYSAELVIDFEDFSYSEIEGFDDEIWSSHNTCLTSGMHVSVGTGYVVGKNTGRSVDYCPIEAISFLGMERVKIDEKKYAFTFNCYPQIDEVDFKNDPFDSINLHIFFGIDDFGYDISEKLTVENNGKIKTGNLITIVTND